MKKSICIVSLSDIERDARVLRQIQYLSPHFDLTVVGYGGSHPICENNPNVRWTTVENSKVPLPVAFELLILGKVWPLAYEKWYWRNQTHVQAYQQALGCKCDAYHANEWNALPLSVEAAKLNGSKVVFDAHEYTPGQYGTADFFRRWLLPDAIAYIFRKYFPSLDASMTAAPAFSKLYGEQFDLFPFVVLNAPDITTLPQEKDVSDLDHIQLVHHGIAKRDRRLETMIETISLCDQRFHLNFMLIKHDPGYRQYLKNLSERIAPGRVRFHEPTPPEKIVQQISQYDIGFYLLSPTNLNNKVSVPNKLFDFIVAGLAVCIGPSPSMAEIVDRYGCGCVAHTFEPRDVARMLNQLDIKDILRMRRAARKAALQLNAENEMKKVVDLYKELLVLSE